MNQLKKATVTSTPLGGSVLKTIYYKYDPLGRRISRHAVDGTDASQTNLRKFYYDGPNIMAEVDAGNNLTATYTHSPLQSDDILGARFTTYATPNGALTAGQAIATGVGNVYYLKDHLNTVNEITNASGDIIQRFEYSAFGKLTKVRDAGGVEVAFNVAPVRTSFTYTGREYEPELGMYYYRARYYDPSIGRFLQKDLDPGRINVPSTFLSKYIYTRNNPISSSDPSGLSDLSRIFDGIAAGIHDFIATFGAGFDNLVKNRLFQGLLAVALYAAAIFINPVSGFTSLGLSIFKASLQGGNTFDNFFKDPLPGAISALAGSYASNEVQSIFNLGAYHNSPLPQLIGGISFFALPLIYLNTLNGFFDSACDTENGSYSGSGLCRGVGK